MARKKETRLQKKIHRALKEHFDVWLFKVWGSMFQMAGVPDLVGCCAGLFFGLEVKTPKGKVSEVQKQVMRDIKVKGGGYCAVVTTPKEAIDYLTRVLREEGKLLEGLKAVTKESRRLRKSTRRLRPSVQTTPRKDLHRRRRA